MGDDIVSRRRVLSDQRIFLGNVSEDAGLGRTHERRPQPDHRAVVRMAADEVGRLPGKSARIAHLKDSKIWIAPGPTITTNRAGRMQSTSGNTIFTGVCWALCSAA